jgi:hypothetical protein
VPGGERLGARDNTHTSPACGVLGLLEVKEFGLEGFMLQGAGERARGVRDNALKSTPGAVPVGRGR